MTTFFNREREKKVLKTLLLKPPTSISLLMGSTSVGKTSLLKTVVKEDKSGCVCYVDCRMTDMTTPSAFAKHLTNTVFPSLLQQAGSLKGHERMFKVFIRKLLSAVSFGNAGPLGFKIDILKILGEDLPSVSDFTFGEVITAYMAILEFLQAEAKGGVYPVLILDEVNVLTPWDTKFPEELKALCRFFAGVSKQESSTHVILATSDFAFQTWITRVLAPEFWRRYDVGELSSSHAKAFFSSRFPSPPAELDNHWDMLYKKVGGNPGNLMCLADACTGPECNAAHDWDKALKVMRSSVWFRLDQTRRPKEGAKFTSLDFAKAALAILNADSKAMVYTDLVDTLGAGVVEGMVEEKLLGVRCFSPLADDIPEAVFGPELCAIVVPPSAVHLAYWEANVDALSQIRSKGS